MLSQLDSGTEAQRDLTPGPFPKKKWELKKIRARADFILPPKWKHIFQNDLRPEALVLQSIQPRQCSKYQAVMIN